MTFTEFAQAVEQKIKGGMTGKCRVEIYTAHKNNNTRRTGLLFSDDSSRTSPTIYLEEWYRLYQEGEELQSIADRILALYEKIKDKRICASEELRQYDQIKNRVAFRLINRQANEILLKEIPHVEFMDLAIVFYVLLETDAGELTSMLIRNVHMRHWETDTETLYRDAGENTPRLLPSEFKSMQEMLREMMNRDEDELMYVLTNDKRSYGAASILYPDCLESIAMELDENYYVLPSSLHEVVIVRESAVPDRAVLKDMVEEINRTQVEEEEVLSNEVYFYDRIEKKLA